MSSVVRYSVETTLKWFGEVIMQELAKAREKKLKEIGAEGVRIMRDKLREIAKRPTGDTENSIMWSTKTGNSSSGTGEYIEKPVGISSVVIGSAHGGFKKIGSIEYGARGPGGRMMEGLGFMRNSWSEIQRMGKQKVKDYSKPIIDKQRT